MADPFLHFWRQYRYTPGTLQAHPADRAWMEQHWPAPLREPYLDWEAYRRSERFGSRDREVHLSHLPAPFWGDLERAGVLIFLKNPGFDNTDYFLESQPAFREAHLRALRQEFAQSGGASGSEEFPFLHLDPRFAWSGSFLWWEQRLRPVIDALQADGMRYLDALHLLSRQVAAVQLFPYRSLDSSRLRFKRGGSTLPSVEQARAFLARRSHSSKQVVLVMRSHAVWHSDACAPQSEHYLHGPRQLGVSLHPRFAAGRALLERVRAAR